ncbi:MAG: hypothetical protein ACPG4K_07960 [Haloferula sp.]
MIDLFLACPTCANNFGSDDNAGSYAILFMLAVIVPMLAGIGFFMVRMIRRSDSDLDPELRDDFTP